MNVNIKSFDVNMDVKTKGIEFEVRNPGGTRLGDCYLTKTELIWCHGKVQRNNGIKIKWEDFIALLSSNDSKKRAVHAVKNPTRN